MVNPPAWERAEKLLLQNYLNVRVLQTRTADLRQGFVNRILLVDGVDQLGLVVLLSHTPEVSNQVERTISIARPAQIIFAVEDGNDVRANALTVIATNVSFGLDVDAQVTQGGLEDFSVGNLGAQSAKVRHWVSSVEI